MLERNSNSERKNHWGKSERSILDAEFEVIGIDDTVTTLRPLEPLAWDRAVQMAMYHTVYTIENYNTPGIMVDTRA